MVIESAAPPELTNGESLSHHRTHGARTRVQR
jgi:hypothetical protein